MRVAIHQPEHLPWFGFIHKIAKADKFVFLDNVQFKKNYFENRNKIVTKQGLLWLTVPVKMKGHTSKKFNEILIDSSKDWKNKYIKTLKQTYGKSPYFNDIIPIIKLISNDQSSLLANLNINIIIKLCELLSIDTEFVFASKICPSGNKSKLLIDILQKVNASEYLMGISSYNYINIDLFLDSKIKIIDHEFNYPDYSHFNYLECFKKEVPSIMDVIANLGAKKVSLLLNQ